jgi:hypothetical protein
VGVVSRALCSGFPIAVASNLSDLCGLDEQVDLVRYRPLEGAHPYVWLDAEHDKSGTGGTPCWRSHKRACEHSERGVARHRYRQVASLWVAVHGAVRWVEEQQCGIVDSEGVDAGRCRRYDPRELERWSVASSP